MFVGKSQEGKTNKKPVTLAEHPMHVHVAVVLVLVSKN